MCATFKVETDAKILTTTFNFSQIKITDFELKKFDDVYPNQSAPIVYVDNGRVTFEKMEWSMRIRGNTDQTLEKKYATYNAVSEEVERKPLYKEQWIERKRCIIPVKGFYEHMVERDTKRKMFITAEKGMLCIAGLWDNYVGYTGPSKCFTMLTCAPNEQVKRVHDRMPVIIHNWRAYLDPRTTPEQAKTLMKPYTGSLNINYAGY